MPCGTQTSPGNEMPSCWKAAHVAACFGENCGRPQSTDAGDRAQKLNQRPERALARAGGLLIHPGDSLIHLMVNLADGACQGIVLSQMKP